MLEFLSYDGYLIQKVFPDIKPTTILLLHRVAELLQFFSALAIVVEIMGTQKVNEIINIISTPPRKIYHWLKKRFFTQSKPPVDHEENTEYERIREKPPPILAMPLISGCLLIVWWLFSEHSLVYWFTYPFHQFVEIVTHWETLSLDTFWDFGWGILKSVYFYFWGIITFAFLIIYPVGAVVTIIGYLADLIVKTDFTDKLFKIIFFGIFVLGFFLEFITSK